MARLFCPPSVVFSPPHCSSPPSWWSPRRPAAARHRAQRIRSTASSTSESSSTTITPGEPTTTTVKLTYLEFNGWVWELDGGFRILVDPILDGNLDFGIPWLFDAAKKTLKNKDGLDLAGVDLLLITQSLDDHCHLRTLTRISAAMPDLPVITTPNARPIVSALPFTNVTYIEPGESTTVGGGTIEVLATAGPVLGPPWQRPENGYILTTTTTDKTSIASTTSRTASTTPASCETGACAPTCSSRPSSGSSSRQTSPSSLARRTPSTSPSSSGRATSCP
ncbi:hypothetical protein ACQ4PT_031931 [Festuca glaucescens]